MSLPGLWDPLLLDETLHPAAPRISALMFSQGDSLMGSAQTRWYPLTHFVKRSLSLARKSGVRDEGAVSTAATGETWETTSERTDIFGKERWKERKGRQGKAGQQEGTGRQRRQFLWSGGGILEIIYTINLFPLGKRMFCSSLPKPKDPGIGLGQACSVSFFGYDSCQKGYACRSSQKNAPKVCEKTPEADRLYFLLLSTVDPDSPEPHFPMDRRVEKIRSHLQTYPYLINLPYDTDGRTFLHLATIKALNPIVQLLLELGADQRVVTKKGETALLFAAALGFDRIVNDFLSACPIVIDLQTVAGHTPLMVAIQKNHMSIVKQLVEKGASLSIQDNNHYTALSYAIVNSTDEIVFYLLEQKATADDALVLALSKKRLNIVNHIIATEKELKKYILSSGVRILAELLSWFAEPITEEQHEIQEKLFHRKDLLDAQESEMKNTALHELASKWELNPARDTVILDHAKRLIEYGADVSILNREGDIALSLEVESCATDGSLVALLLDAGSDINIGYIRGSALKKAKDHYLGPLMVSILQAKTSEERNVFLKQISSKVMWKTLFNRSRENKNRFLGKGAYGQVQRVEKNGKFYAVKRIQLDTNKANGNKIGLNKEHFTTFNADKSFIN